MREVEVAWGEHSLRSKGEGERVTENESNIWKVNKESNFKRKC